MSKPRSLALPPRTRVRRLDTVRGPFAVLDAEPGGERRGTVLLLPGYTGSKEDFLALLGPLTEAGYRAVAVDGRGQHDSPGPRGRAAYRRRALALDAVAQAAALGDGPVHLVGHSFGGLVARAAVAVAPDAFRSLTLLSSGVGRVSRPQRVRVRALRAGLALLSKDRVWRAMCWLDSRGEEPDTSDVPGLADFLLRRWTRTRIAQLRGAGRLLLDRRDGTEELLALRTPLHFAYGTDEMVWSTVDLAAAAARTGAHHTVLAGAGHSPNVSHPEELTARLLGFWERVVAPPEVSTAP
ncbi:MULTISPECIES: alpha/beta fold hydrolase [unclassified Streptomyces]|uniref:alpha/beta fold hydrolase n=1 Tax=unclassified Streptomyces TaxID=2593676 RepID=UPI0006AEF936|nr:MULTISPECIES: alpha/beta hydrolase [unclassified Streptomyces]KOX34935.1 hydrolase [Streptomyces sp. NRRL F-6491]KOX50854.1 hydrolase [Streptomyces sp. NRRL F-6492]